MEKRINDQEELIKELAEKLIVANDDKDEMFAEYEKILQNTVFNKEEIEMRLSGFKSEKRPRSFSPYTSSKQKKSDSVCNATHRSKKTTKGKG